MQSINENSKHKRRRERRYCEFCGKPFIWRISNPEQHFCSLKCEKMSVEGKKIKNKICEYCGKSFEYKNKNQKYCSEFCRMMADNKSEQNKKRNVKVSGEKQSTFFENVQQNLSDIHTHDLKDISNNQTTRESLKSEKKERLGDNKNEKTFSYNKTERRKCLYCGNEFEWFPAKPFKNYCCKECKEKSTEQKNNNNKMMSPEDEILYIEVATKVKNLIEQSFRQGNTFQNYNIDYWNIGDIGKRIRQEVLNRDNYECQICKRKEGLHIHHIIKRRDGGDHNTTNLVTLCASCHRHIETGDVTHAIRECFKNAKKYYCVKEIKQEADKSKRSDLKDMLEQIFFDLEKVSVENFGEILIELDDMIDLLSHE